MAARERQYARGALNAHLGGRELEAACNLSTADRTWLAGVLERLRLSARAYHRVLRVALTLADLAGKPQPERDELMEAIGYRQLDRQLRQG